MTTTLSLAKTVKIQFKQALKLSSNPYFSTELEKNVGKWFLISETWLRGELVHITVKGTVDLKRVINKLLTTHIIQTFLRWVVLYSMVFPGPRGLWGKLLFVPMKCKLQKFGFLGEKIGKENRLSL